MTLAEIEAALDSGQLEAEMTSGRWWTARRNGKTRRWKTQPDRWEIPCKAGLRACGTIKPDNLQHYRIKPASHLNQPHQPTHK